VSPYVASGVLAGHSVDKRFVALSFQTNEGVPIQVAMEPNLVRDTIKRLTE
jgi:hypothetical protein